ncbi:hypothetical protein CEXT_47651 [Caerostris extrusa]|uniref:Uncharacterized protein n=1 Tax=Caerostris extrusa TaxID=172846 RepID=A0AAV4W0N9_CAEEX|nr:hypothetical protein CEXT_47651 [Caerostris extrusa]
MCIGCIIPGIAGMFTFSWIDPDPIDDVDTLQAFHFPQSIYTIWAYFLCQTSNSVWNFAVLLHSPMIPCKEGRKRFLVGILYLFVVYRRRKTVILAVTTGTRTQNGCPAVP